MTDRKGGGRKGRPELRSKPGAYPQRLTLLATVSAFAILTAASPDFLGRPAFAQDATQEPLVETPEGATMLEKLVATATRIGENVYDTLSGSSAATRDQLEVEMPGAPVSQIMTLVPGVTTQTSADDPGIAINMRGLQDFGRVNVMVDGARQNFQKNGHEANGTFYLDTNMLKAVEVTRGPSSVVYGSGAIGGVVNFTTIDADDVLQEGATKGGRVKLGLDTNGFGPTVHGEAAIKIEDAAEFVIAGTWFQPDDYSSGDGEDIESAQDLRSGLAKAKFRPTDDQEITLSATRYFNTFENGTSSIREVDVTVDTYTAGYRYTPDSDFWDLSAKVYYTSTLSDQAAAAGALGDSEQSFDIGTAGLDIFNTSKFDTGAFSHELTYGADIFRDRVTTVDAAGSSDDLTPSGTRVAYGTYVQDKISFDDWLEVIGALRYDGYSLKDDDVRIDGERLSPKITVGVTPWEQVTFYTTYAEGYRAPAITETLIDGFHPPPVMGQFFPNPNLRPEVAHTIEAGVNLRFDDVIATDQLRVKLGVFQNDVDDYIDQVFQRFPIPGGYQYQNIAKARIKGFEFEANYDAGTIFAGLSGQIMDGENLTDGGPLQKVPPFRVVTSLGFRALDERLTAGTRLTVVGKKDDDLATGFVGEAYQLVDLFANFEVNDTTTANLQLNNIFDREYTQYLNADPSPGFNAKASLTIKF
ncbi:TonB-dependent hemoglobin/transferrin/lactoferrin family receptor [Rhizobium herbae]|uniref:Hemoglobin/transferrin/lactoferrin receptor protein n=1 Tax=Rhizobium herbae TaxID=508661 RepID=A0ABS4ERF9_9HYPH|nr:TonB-dependent hemoglobin/transferrin/lactoferrin family receptor [Rhizobium herbae]MBP1860536.1 hemoglobin/transferrin/lactoferrin receptor protein [Rhizobium herbae]